MKTLKELRKRKEENAYIFGDESDMEDIENSSQLDLHRRYFPNLKQVIHAKIEKLWQTNLRKSTTNNYSSYTSTPSTNYTKALAGVN